MDKGSVDPKAGTETTWTAPDAAGIATVTATFDDGSTCVILFNVVEPRELSMIKEFQNNDYFNPGDQGVMYFAKWDIGPDSVSFGYISIREGSGPGSNPTGEFADTTVNGKVVKKGRPMEYHYANPDNKIAKYGHWQEIDCDNTGGDDFIVIGYAPGSHATGSFVWDIPYQWKCRSAADADAKKFLNLEQEFILDASVPSATINKANISGTR